MKIQVVALLIVVGLIINTFSVFGRMNSQNDELKIGDAVSYTHLTLPTSDLV